MLSMSLDLVKKFYIQKNNKFSAYCSGGTLDTCTACNADKYRELEGTKCVCMAGYYETNANVEECSSCHYSW